MCSVDDLLIEMNNTATRGSSTSRIPVGWQPVVPFTDCDKGQFNDFFISEESIYLQPVSVHMPQNFVMKYILE